MRFCHLHSYPTRTPSLAPLRVVVTGRGMVTALGANWAANAVGFRAGHSGFRPVTRFPVDGQRVRIAAEVTLPADLPLTLLGRRRLGRLDVAAKLLVLATYEALESARWRPAGTVPLVLGTTSGQMSLGEAFYRQATQDPGCRRHQAERTAQYQPQAQAVEAQVAFGFGGPVTLIANACASGANAVGHAWHLVRSGQATRVIVGGYEALSQLVFAGFGALQALSTTVCRPFDTQRDGLALGEGAAMFVLESLPSAEQRGADILGEVVGYGARTDLHHLTQPHPDGLAAQAAMQDACAVAGVAPEAVGYLNAHGTGTPANDGSEAAAIARWAGDHAPALAVSSTKAGVGHLLGAAGAVEFGICLMALGGGWLPPMRTTRTADPACTFDLVRAPRDARVEYALTNSFGFGGANASLLVRRWS